MRAAVLHGPLDLRIEEVPEPVAGPGEVVLAVEAALTGGTSAKIVRRGYHARMGAPPLRLGHEGAGHVEAVGSGVSRFAVGDRVLPGNSGSCGDCVPCRRGMTAQCLDMVWLTGLFAERVTIPARIVEHNLHRLPDPLPARTAALAENLATVLKGFDRTPARKGDRAVVVGTGALGLLWTRVLAAAGAVVTSVGRRRDRDAVARTLGAAAVEDAGAFAERAVAGEVEADLVVEAVGTIDSWRTALAAARAGGRVHLFGGPPRGTTIDLDAERLHYDELLVTSSFHHTPYHLAEAIRLLTAGFVPPDLLIGEQVSLEGLPASFRRHFEGGGPPKACMVPRPATP